MSRGNLYIISGPSGAGKSTVLDIIFSKTENAYFSVSATTREMREGEVEGSHYHFVSREEFEEMKTEDKLLEYAEFVGNMYGTPRAPIEEMTKSGKNVFLDIELQGVKQIKESMPEAVSILLIPPNIEELEKRLFGRKTDTEEKIRKRIEAAKNDCKEAHIFDYIVINADVNDAAEDILSIIRAENCKAGHMLEYINRGSFC